MLFRNKFCGASFLVGQGRGCNTILPDLDVNPGTGYLDAAPPLSPHQEPIGDHRRTSAWMDVLSSPIPRSHGNVAYLSRAWPSEVRGLRIMRSGVSAHGATEGRLHMLYCSAARILKLSRPARVHRLVYIMTVLRYGRGYAGGHF